ncbi:MAG: hypothetical protein AAF604_17215 [Acidobacteriota bacterium]
MDLAPEGMDPASFRERGFLVVQDVAPRAGSWARAVLSGELAPVRVELEESQRALCRGRGSARSYVFDRFATDQVIPELEAFYQALLPILASATGSTWLESPFARSAYTVKIYQPESCSQGWHVDTNSLTALLYLTTNAQGGETVIRGLDGQVHRVRPVAGSLLLMDGVRCEHRAEPVELTPKVVCLLNYYDHHPQRRDLEMDGLAFGDPPLDQADAGGRGSSGGAASQQADPGKGDEP